MLLPVAVIEGPVMNRPSTTTAGVNSTLYRPVVSTARLARLFTEKELEVSLAISRQLSLAVEHKRSEDQLRASEERLRLATQTGLFPVFEGRDQVVRYSVAEIEPERRNGYRWYTDEPSKLLNEDYPAWRKKWRR